MSMPDWVTPEGSLGSFRANELFTQTLLANPVFPSSGMNYFLLNGSLPKGLFLSVDGVISGTPEPIINDTTYKFTVRAIDNSGNLRDRTFSVMIYGGLKPQFITPSGNILTIVDSVFTEKQLEYTAALNEKSIDVTLISGSLPPGLELSKKGLIRGYAAPPISPNGNPTSKDYKFTVKLVNDLGTATSTYEITVNNHNLTKSINSRKPVVLNYYPPTFQIEPDNPLYSLFLKDNKIPMVKSGNYFSFKILGKDFDDNDLTYQFFDLPAGLNGDPLTGWITGTPVLNTPGVVEYWFSVRVTKTKYEYIRKYGVPSGTQIEIHRDTTEFVIPDNYLLFINDIKQVDLNTVKNWVPNQRYLEGDVVKYNNQYYQANKLITREKSSTFNPIDWDQENNLGYRFVKSTDGVDTEGNTIHVADLVLQNPSPNNASVTVIKFTFGISSETYTFVLPVVRDIKTQVIWETPEDLGVIYNSSISDLYVKGEISKNTQSVIVKKNNEISLNFDPVNKNYLKITIDEEEISNDLFYIEKEKIKFFKTITIGSTVTVTQTIPLEYELVNGSLPPNLKLLPNGDIVGRVVHQPTEKVLNKGENTTYNFVVKAYSPEFPLINDTRGFTLVVNQYYKTPTESMYFKASPSLVDRKILDSLLTDENLIPKSLLYRPNDKFFGKAEDVKFVQVYGINAGSVEKYVAAIEQNHYWRNVILGEIKTAVAKDDFGNVMYEVVYSEVLDDLTNDKGQSVDKKVRWPRFIDLNKGPWVASEGEVYTSYIEDKTTNTKYHTSLTPGATVVVYPASFTNMRLQIAENLDENFDSKLLPRWMRSQQENGSIPGYVQCWVICYTLPGKAKIIKNNIDTLWPHKLNDIAFELDRYIVDKSNTYDYNTYLATPAWQNLPSSSQELATLDQKDFYVLFPRKTILPK